MDKQAYMQAAIAEALHGISEGHGGPFGCVIVKEGEIIGRGHNCVLKKQDPTCHGEMEAIRHACATLGTFDLTGCELYTTAEPCPMCLGAILWANIRTVYYGCNCSDTEAIGFRDSQFYAFLSGKADLLERKELGRADCLNLFAQYRNQSGSPRY